MVDVSTDSTSDHVVLSVSGFGFCVGLDGVAAVTFCANSHIAVLFAHGSLSSMCLSEQTAASWSSISLISSDRMMA